MHPLNDIENKKGNQDMGRMLFQMYEGAKMEGATELEAIRIIRSFAFGMFKASQTEDVEDEAPPG